jgi:transposase
VAQTILYDNNKPAEARILEDRKRKLTRVFSELLSHYLFDPRFGRPGKGNHKRKVESLVGLCAAISSCPYPSFRASTP